MISLKSGAIYILLVSSLSLSCFAQSTPYSNFLFRIGATGTGTYDKGLWYFKEISSLSPQEFVFENSWGIALDAEIHYGKRWSTGIHLASARTTFRLTTTPDLQSGWEDHTSMNFMMIEQKIHRKGDPNFKPFIGITLGPMYTRDIELEFGRNIPFTFKNPIVYGAVFGFDHRLGQSSLMWHTVIRALTFEFTTLETDITYEQRLLDQVWWMNYNHIQVGISKFL